MIKLLLIISFTINLSVAFADDIFFYCAIKTGQAMSIKKDCTGKNCLIPTFRSYLSFSKCAMSVSESKAQSFCEELFVTKKPQERIIAILADANSCETQLQGFIKKNNKEHECQVKIGAGGKEIVTRADGTQNVITYDKYNCEKYFDAIPASW